MSLHSQCRNLDVYTKTLNKHWLKNTFSQITLQSFQARIERENEKAHWFSKKVTEEIFSNLRVIYSFHRNFLLPDLENRLKEW